jgi:hypothetical protein
MCISVSIVLGYELDDRGSRVRFPAGAANFSLHHRVQKVSGAHPASYPMGTRALSLGVKRPGREADRSPPYSAEAKNSWSYTSTPQYVLLALCSVKAQGQVYLYFLCLPSPDYYWAQMHFKKAVIYKALGSFLSYFLKYTTYRFMIYI